MTTITITAAEECTGYACPPAETVDLPECEYGWEIGNGTAVCATQQPQPDALAATGPTFNDFGAMMILGVAVAIVIVGTGLVIWGRRKNKDEA